MVHLSLSSLFFDRARERRVRWSLAGQLYFLLFPNMVLAKTDIRERRTKQTRRELHVSTPYEFLVGRNNCLWWNKSQQGGILSIFTKS